MKKILVHSLVISFIFISGCKKIPEDDVEPYKGKNYFPVNTGHELIYDVEHITFDNFTGVWDTSVYQIKEIVESAYTDNQGRETQKIERYIDNDTTAGFVIYRVWVANLLTSSAQRQEENIRYIRLVFPQTLNQTWDGNSLNTLGLRYYKYTVLHEALSLNGLTYDSTCAVLQQQESSLISDVLDEEKYATNVGMIYRLNRNIQYSAPGIVSSASIYKETLVSFIK